MKDNPIILNKYRKPNADGQIATHCIFFDNRFNTKNYKKDTCSVNWTLENEVMQECEILNGQFCDCYTKGNGYEV